MPKQELKFPLHQFVEVDVWCEECSTVDHPVPCDEIEGIFYRCPLCNKQVMILAEIKTQIGSHYSYHCKKCQELEKKGIVFGKKQEIEK